MNETKKAKMENVGTKGRAEESSGSFDPNNLQYNSGLNSENTSNITAATSTEKKIKVLEAKISAMKSATVKHKDVFDETKYKISDRNVLLQMMSRFKQINGKLAVMRHLPEQQHKNAKR